MRLAVVLITMCVLAFVAGAVLAFFMTGKSRKWLWYLIMVCCSIPVSGLLSYIAYKFTEGSVFYESSSKAGMAAFEYSFSFFFVLVTLFIGGMWLGDILEQFSPKSRKQR